MALHGQSQHSVGIETSVTASVKTTLQLSSGLALLNDTVQFAVICPSLFGHFFFSVDCLELCALMLLCVRFFVVVF